MSGAQGLDVVEILFEDAETTELWSDRRKLEDFAAAPCIVAKVGYLLEEGPDRIVLSGAQAYDGDHTSVWKIPRSVVRMMRFIGRGSDPSRPIRPAAEEKA